MAAKPASKSAPKPATAAPKPPTPSAAPKPPSPSPSTASKPAESAVPRAASNETPKASAPPKTAAMTAPPKTALAKSPSAKTATKATPKTASGITRVSPGVYRNAQGQRVNAQGARIDSRGRPVKVAKPAGQQPAAGGQAGTAQPPTWNQQPTTPELLGQKPEEQMKQLGGEAADLSQQAIVGGMAYNPNTAGAGYQQAFQQQGDDAYNAIMNQFNQSTQKQFAQQDAEFQQRMAEQGIDPNSGRWQTEYNNIKQQQNQAQQQAMNSANEAKWNVVNQGFNQYQQAQMTPFQMAAMMGQYTTMPYEYGQKATQAELDRQAQLAATRLGTGAQVASARIGAAGGVTQQQIQSDTALAIAQAQAMGQNQNPYNRNNTFGNNFAQGLPGGAAIGATNR